MSSSKIGRTELAAKLAAEHGLSKTVANDILTTLVDEIQGQLAKGNCVAISGFGTFEARHRAARVGRNPKTGESLKIAASVTPAFKVGATFKAVVAKG